MTGNLKHYMKNKTVLILSGMILIAVVAVAAMFILMNSTKELSAGEYMKRAEADYKDQDYEQAVLNYQKAIKADESLLDAYIGEAKAYEGLKGAGNASEILSSAITYIEKTFKAGSKTPDSVKQVYYEFADLYVAQKDSSSAYQILKGGERIVAGLLEGYKNKDFKNPEQDDYVNKEGYAIYGSYPQTEVAKASITDEIKQAKYNKNDIAKVGDVTYRRLIQADKSYRYFVFEPIKWRVINSDGKGYLLLADRALDAIPYNDKYEASSWETSTLRTWLTGYFYDIAFSDAEKKNMMKMKLTPSRNPDYGVVTGDNVQDFVTIPATEEISEKANGFDGTRKDKLESRLCDITEFSQAAGVGLGLNNMCKWWVRTCGVDNMSASYVNFNGIIACDGYYVIGVNIGVRPMIYLSKDKVKIEQ